MKIVGWPVFIRFFERSAAYQAYMRATSLTREIELSKNARELMQNTVSSKTKPSRKKKAPASFLLSKEADEPHF
jgi:hypothetical protein